MEKPHDLRQSRGDALATGKAERLPFICVNRQNLRSIFFFRRAGGTAGTYSQKNLALLTLPTLNLPGKPTGHELNQSLT